MDDEAYSIFWQNITTTKNIIIMKNKNQNNKSIFLLVVIITCLLHKTYSQQISLKPNIVLIMVDDAGWGDFASNGNLWVTTPNIDQIRQEGLMINRFYVSPFCAPTRASLLTGRYHLRTGTAGVTRGMETMRSEEITIAEILRDAGYNTGIFGKWHNGAHYPENPLGQGFNEFLGFCGGTCSNYFNTKLQHNNQMINTKGYITDVLTDAALRFIETNKSNPFFCYIPYNVVHHPYQVPEKYLKKYEKSNLLMNDKVSYAMIDNMDENIGRVIKKLNELKLTNNTIVIFLSDNGPSPDRAGWNGNMKGKKGTVDEGGVRVPFFIKWPGHIQRGSNIERIAAHIDILPTLVEMAGIKIPENDLLDGKSLVPLINNKNTEWPERVIFTHLLYGFTIKPAPGAIRSSQYRFVIDNNGNELLYDMLSDPDQKNNIAELKPKMIKEYKQKYNSWFNEVIKNGISSEITKVGFTNTPVVEFYAPDVSYWNGVVFSAGPGWGHDWLTGWNTSIDIAEWTIEVVDDGVFQIELKYNCGDDFKGRSIITSIGNQKLSRVLDKSFSGKPIYSPDRVKRIEAYQKEWGLFNMGKIKLLKGIYKLSVQTEGKDVAGKFQLKSVILRKL